MDEPGSTKFSPTKSVQPSLVQSSKDGEVGILTVNNPPVNALSPGVPEGIVAGLEQCEKDDPVKAIVLIGGGRTFIAGADIKEFGKITSSGDRRKGPGFLGVLDRVENYPKPVVVAIHGTAFGGGLETAMAGHYRVAVPSAQVGQPEVKLGIIPGAAGTQRLPRLAGVAKAVEMCAAGDPIGCRGRARIRHRRSDYRRRSAAGRACFRAHESRNAAAPHSRLERQAGQTNDQRADFCLRARAARKKARNLMAPLAAIDAVEAATKLPFDEGVKREAELFQECLFSEQSKALIHAFFGERAVAKIPGISKDTRRSR